MLLLHISSRSQRLYSEFPALLACFSDALIIKLSKDENTEGCLDCPHQINISDNQVEKGKCITRPSCAIFFSYLISIPTVFSAINYIQLVGCLLQKQELEFQVFLGYLLFNKIFFHKR
jgi:hypothetical protein